MFNRVVILVMAFLLLVFAGFYHEAAAASLAWDPSGGVVTGYNVHYGTSPSNYANHVNVGNVTQYSLDNLPLQEGVLYYLAVTAYNTAGESGYSNYVTWRPGDTTPPSPPAGLSVQ